MPIPLASCNVFRQIPSLLKLLAPRMLRSGIAFAATFWAITAVATLNTNPGGWVAGMTASGSAPFDSLDPTAGDNNVRTNDAVSYRVGFTTLGGADTNARLVLRTGSFTLPGTYTGAPLSQVSKFVLIDIPTGPNGCQNISSVPVADPPAPNVSGITSDGQTLFCAQTSPTSGNNLDFKIQIRGDAPNGALVSAPLISYESDQTSPANSAPEVLNTVIGAETFYGLPQLTVRATPRWNLHKNQLRGAIFIPGSGPAGEDGFVFSWTVGIYAKGSRKGLEALQSPISITENFNDPNYPNARFITWNINSPGYMLANMSATGTTPQNGCGDWKSEFFFAGNVVDNSYYFPNDLGNVVGTNRYTVARGGDCFQTAFDNTAKTATLSIVGTDFSLNNYPTLNGSNPAASTLINPLNPDDSTNQWWVANKTVMVWTPATDPPIDVATPLTNTAHLVASSISGQSNIDPVPADDVNASYALRTVAGSLNKSHATMKTSNPFGLDFAPCDPAITGDCIVNQVAPGQIFTAYLAINNSGTSSFGPGKLCDKIDNSRFTFFDASSAAYSPYYRKDPNTGVQFVYLSGPATPFVFELGVGGTGIGPSGTWTTMNSDVNEYGRPATTGSAQSDSGCEDSDATWYPSVSAVTTALGASGVQNITRVRIKYSSLPNQGILFWIPQQANATYTFSGNDLSPNAAFTAGASTVNSLGVNQLLWNTGVPSILSGGNGRSSDSVRIYQTEYTQISKSSPTNAPSASLVPLGQVVTYDLQVNLTTSGSAHTTSVDVWDVLPQYLNYIPGSATFGGAPLSDPVCASTGLPTALFPALAGPPAVAAGSVQTGLVACRWTLNTQTAAKAARGSIAGNLPLLTFNAAVGVTAPNGTQLLNTSFADSSNNNLAKATYRGANVGFACGSGQLCSVSSWLLNVSATPGVLLNKQVSKTLTPIGSSFTYTLTYGGLGANLDGLRILEILPYSGDTRSPASNYSGSMQLTGPIAPPVASSSPIVTVADPQLITLYTTNSPANIQSDPYHVSQVLNGGGTNSAVSTNWCSAAQIPSPNCPSTYSAATAVLLLVKGAAASPFTSPAGDIYQASYSVSTSGNAIGNRYSNNFVGDSPSLTARRPSSNIVTTTVVAPDLILIKTVSPTTSFAGDTVAYSLTAKTNTGANLGPILASPAPTIRVTDTLPVGLSLVAPLPSGSNWDCSASSGTAVSCLYTGPLPIGVGGTIGGPITVNALVAATQAHGSTLTNAAAVSMTGQTESNTGNNAATAALSVLRRPDLVMVKTASVTTARQGDSISYMLRITNKSGEGPVTGGPLTVTDNLPAGIAISAATAASGTGWDCSASAAPSSVSCTYSGTYPVAAGAQVGADITVVATVGSSAATGAVPNSASVSVSGETNTADNSSIATITIQPGLAGISGRVYRDSAANASDDGVATDPGIVGITVTLCRVNESPCLAANTVSSTTTSSDGNYSFTNVPSGNYFVVQSQPSSYGSSTVNIVPVSRGGATPITGVSFGETLSRLSGFVYADINADGTRAATGENGVGSGMTITLSGTTTDPISGADLAYSVTVTADPITGAYLIDNIPAPKAGTTYRLTETPGTQTSYTNGTTNTGTPGFATGTVSTAAGSANSGASEIAGIGFAPGTAAVAARPMDASNYNFGEIPQAGVTGRVYLDTAANGVDDGLPTDPGIGGVIVTLCRVNQSPCLAVNTVGTGTTAPDGTYLIPGVPAGSYFAIQTQPSGYGSSTTNVVPVTRTGSATTTGISFGETGARLSGMVYRDVNFDRLRTAADSAFTASIVTIKLSGIDSNNNPVNLTALTDSSGNYSFTNLPAPNAAGYTVTLQTSTVAAPFQPFAANPGTLTTVGTAAAIVGSAATTQTAISGIRWTPSTTIATQAAAIGVNYDFGLVDGADVSGRVMRDVNRNGTGNSTTDSADLPIAGVTLTLCKVAAEPCPAASIVATTTTLADGTYRFVSVPAGAYFVVETQPITLGNAPSGVNVVSVTVTGVNVTGVDFLERPASIAGTVWRDNNNDAQRGANEPGLQGIIVTLSGTDAAGQPVSRTATTDAQGQYVFNDLPAPNAAGFTLTKASASADTRDSAAILGGLTLDNGAAQTNGRGAVTALNILSAISLPAGGTGAGYDYGVAPATAGVSGTVWRDVDSNRMRGASEQTLAGWTVQLVKNDANGNLVVITSQITGADGKYNFTNQLPGDYQVAFRSPTVGADGQPLVWGTPINGEQGAPISNSNASISGGIIQKISLLADQQIPEQSLPLDPSGVVYDAVVRTPVPGAIVQITGPAGFDPAIHLMGGAAAANQTVGKTGEYQFLLLPGAPAGEYSIAVKPPAGYVFQSSLIPPSAGVLTPPANPAIPFLVVGNSAAPQLGSSESTTYWLRFNLTVGVSSGIIHNHIPLDPAARPVLMVSKSGDRSAAELGDSVKYTVRVRNSGNGVAPSVRLVDNLPAGFTYIAGTSTYSSNGNNTAIPLADPVGGRGPQIVFRLPKTLGIGEDASITYRVRLGVGAMEGTGINQVQASSGVVSSNVARFAVKVNGGVFAPTACVVGKVYVDCNGNHVQDAEELGIPGVRLYFQDGSSVLSDSEGKYSACGLPAMTHTLKVDKITLPRGSRLTTSSSRNVGDAGSLFLDLKAGELHRADFIEGSCSNTILEQVKARRTKGEVRNPEQELKGSGALKFVGKPAQAPAQATDSANQPVIPPRPEREPEKPARHEQDVPVPALPAASSSTQPAGSREGAPK